MDIRIRTAGPEDLAAAVSLLAECDLPTADVDADGLAHFLVAQADDADELVGMIGLEPYEGIGLLRSLAVRPTHRGRGIAETLVTALEQRANDRGIRDLYLLTTTAARYFARRAYEPVERTQVPNTIQTTREFSDLCPDSAMVMMKTLSSA